MLISIQIKTDNQAFDEDPMAEVASIIEDAVAKLENLPVGSTENLYDTNGNRCGFVEVMSS